MVKCSVNFSPDKLSEYSINVGYDFTKPIDLRASLSKSELLSKGVNVILFSHGYMLCVLMSVFASLINLRAILNLARKFI
jgi:hypothetical protein